MKFFGPWFGLGLTILLSNTSGFALESHLGFGLGKRIIKPGDGLSDELVGIGDMEGLKQELDQGANINCLRTGAYTPLDIAIFLGKLDLVEFLLTQGANRYVIVDPDATRVMRMGCEPALQRRLLEITEADGMAEKAARERCARHKRPITERRSSIDYCAPKAPSWFNMIRDSSRLGIAESTVPSLRRSNGGLVGSFQRQRPLTLSVSPLSLAKLTDDDRPVRMPTTADIEELGRKIAKLQAEGARIGAALGCDPCD